MGVHISPPSSSLTLPADYARIQLVHSFSELIATPFTNGVNALCWPRVLPGNFQEVAEKLAVSEGVLMLDAAILNALNLSPAGRVAVDVMLADYQLLKAHELDPVLDCIRAYPRDEAPEVMPTDVYSFHADSAPVEAATFLCTYYGASSEGLRNDQAMRRVDDADTRAELLKLYGGADDADFCEFLNACCYDLHYMPMADAVPFPFGLGHVWRIAVEHPASQVPPCIHRAPTTLPGDAARLLLIS